MVALLERPWPIEKPCKGCRAEPGSRGLIRKTTDQNCLYCRECGTYNEYNVPKARTGEPQRTIKSRPDLPVGMRARILRLDGYRCFLCGRGAEQGVFLDVAHALSIKEGRALGVSDDELNDVEGNLFACCEECNHDMGTRSFDPRQYLRLMLARTRRGQQQ
jgi:5-methylcytosine-specific restriction endonuclease McrA